MHSINAFNDRSKPSILASNAKGYTPKGNYESVNYTTSNYEERKAPAGNQYRSTSYGDD